MADKILPFRKIASRSPITWTDLPVRRAIAVSAPSPLFSGEQRTRVDRLQKLIGKDEQAARDLIDMVNRYYDYYGV